MTWKCKEDYNRLFLGHVLPLLNVASHTPLDLSSLSWHVFSLGDKCFPAHDVSNTQTLSQAVKFSFSKVGISTASIQRSGIIMLYIGGPLYPSRLIKIKNKKAQTLGLDLGR